MFSDDQVRQAQRLAEVVHRHQVRDHGVPYIEHPQTIVHWLSVWQPHRKDLHIVGWLHDTLEDGDNPDVIAQQIQQLFGPEILHHVQKLTKPWVAYPARYPRVPPQSVIEAYWDQLVAARPINLVKWADRLSNLNDLSHASPDKQRRYAMRTWRDFFQRTWVGIPADVSHQVYYALQPFLVSGTASHNAKGISDR